MLHEFCRFNLLYAVLLKPETVLQGTFDKGKVIICYDGHGSYPISCSGPISKKPSLISPAVSASVVFSIRIFSRQLRA